MEQNKSFIFMYIIFLRIRQNRMPEPLCAGQKFHISQVWMETSWKCCHIMFESRGNLLTSPCHSSAVHGTHLWWVLWQSERLCDARFSVVGLLGPCWTYLWATGDLIGSTGCSNVFLTDDRLQPKSKTKAHMTHTLTYMCIHTQSQAWIFLEWYFHWYV